MALQLKLNGDPYPAQLDFETEVFVSYVTPSTVGELKSSETLQVPLADLTGDSTYVGEITSTAILDKPVTTGGTIGQRLNVLGAENISVRLVGKILGSAPGTSSPWAETNPLDNSLPAPEITSLSVAAFQPGASARNVTVAGHNMTTVIAAVVEGLAGVTVSNADATDASTVKLDIAVASDAEAGSRTLRLLGLGGLSPVSALARINVIDPGKPQILTVTLPQAQTGQSYQFQLQSAGGTGAVSWAFRSGSFPAGLAIGSNGALSGTPAIPGTYVFDLSVRDAATNEDRRTFILDVAPPPSDGRDALAFPCDAYADAASAPEDVTTPERATGASDPAFATLTVRQPPAAGYFPASLSLVSQLSSGSYLVLDMGPAPCEWIQARPLRTSDALLDVGGPYRPALLVWVSASATTLDRLVISSAPGSGSIGSGRFPLDAGSDGTLYRYVIIALNDSSPARIDDVERTQNDLLPPDTLSAGAEVREAGLPKQNGTDVHLSLSGDDTQGGADLLGRIGTFSVQLHNLTTGIFETAVSVPVPNGLFTTLDVTGLDDGHYEATVAAQDLFGNTDATPATTSFLIDSTGPEITGIALEPANAIIPTGGSVVLTATAGAADQLSDVVSVTGLVNGPGGPYGFDLSSPGDGDWSGVSAGIEVAGTFSVGIYALDSVGNASFLSGGNTVLTTNQAPAASAGNDYSVPELTLTALSASATVDPEGDTITYSWAQISGTPVTLQGSGVSVSFFTPELFTNTPAPLTFRVTATDSRGAAATDDIIVTVSNVNLPPVVSAGSNVTIPDTVPHSLQGTATDPEGDTPALLWTQLSGPPVGITGQTVANPSFNPPSAAGGDVVLVFQLTATDDLAASASGTVTITVSVIDSPPVASAGATQNLFDTTALFLDGTASYDPEGGGLTYLWSLTSGNAAHLPGWAAVNKTTPTISIAQINSGADEIFIFHLDVRDGANQLGSANVTVNVKHLCTQVVSLANASKPAGDPIAQAVDAGRQFVLSSGSTTLVYRDWGTATRGELSLAAGAGLMMAQDESRRVLWIASTSALERIDLTSLTSTTQPLTAAPLAIAVESGAGQAAVLTDTAGGRLEIFNSTGAPENTLDLGRSNAGELRLAGSPFSGKFVIADADVPGVLVVDPAVPAVSTQLNLSGDLQITGLAINPASGEIAVVYSGGILEVTEGGGIIVNRVLDNEPGSRYDAIYLDTGHLFAVRGLGAGEATSTRSLYRSSTTDFTASSTALPDPGNVSVNVPSAGGVTGDYLAGPSPAEVAVLEARTWGTSYLHIVTGASEPYSVTTVSLGKVEPLSVRYSGGRYFVLTAGGDLLRVTAPSTVEADRPAALLGTLAVNSIGQLAATDQRARRVWQVTGQNPTLAVTRKELDGRGVSMLLESDGPLVNETGFDRSSAVTSLVLAGGLGEIAWGASVSQTGDFVAPPVHSAANTYAARGGQSFIEVYDNSTGNQTKTIPTTLDPVRLAVSANDTRLAAIDPVQKKVAIFKLDTGDPEILLPTGSGPAELAFNGDGSRLLVRERDTGRVLVINSTTGTALGEITIPVTSIPSPTDVTGLGRRSIVFHTGSSSFYVTSGTNLLRVSADGSASQLITPVALASIASIDVISGYVVAVDGGRRFYLVNPAENFRSSRVSLPVTPVDSPFNLVAADPSGNLLYVGGGHTVSVIDFRGACSSSRPVTYAALVPENTGTRFARSGQPGFWQKLASAARSAIRQLFAAAGNGTTVQVQTKPGAAPTAVAGSYPYKRNNPMGGGLRPNDEGVLP